MTVSRHRQALLTLALLVAALAPAASQGPPERVDVLIAFHSAPGPADENLVRDHGGKIKRKFQIVPAIAANLPEQAAEALRRNPRVAVVEPDGRVFAVDAELDNSWGVKRIGSGTVHTNGNRGAGVKVAIIDSGIDYNHPDLAANYEGGYDFVNGDADPFDDNKHGTHVAGIVAARDDDAGVVGVAPEVRILAYKVLAADGTGSFSDVIAALESAMNAGAHVTNSSFGSSGDPGVTTKAAYDNAAAAGILHVAAAGNSGNCFGTGDSVLYPARYDSVIAVAATDSSDNSPCFSSTGPDVELSGPGVAVNSTVPGGGYEVLDGTSMASPHVAGAAALVLAAGVTDTSGNGHVNDEVRQILIDTAIDLGDVGRDTWYGYGLVDAAAAVGAGNPPPPTAGVTVALTTDKATYSTTDTAAQLTAVVRDENGTAITGLASTAFVTTLDGTGQAVTFTETATPGTYTGSLDISSAAHGSHTVNVTVTDTRNLAGSDSATFDVAGTLHAQSIKYSTYGGPNGKRHLLIAVRIVDEKGFPVSGATVSVILWRNGSLYGAANGTSNSAGDAWFEARWFPAGCYTTTVEAVIAGDRVWDETTPPNQYCK